MCSNFFTTHGQRLFVPGSNGNFPLHELCRNESEITDELAILMFMLDIDQTVVRERRNEEGEFQFILLLVADQLLSAEYSSIHIHNL